MILTFSQPPRAVTCDDPAVPHEILARALTSHVWANVNGRALVKFRAEITQSTYTDPKTNVVVTVPATLEIGDEIP